MKYLYVAFIAILFTSCIPVKVAPQIADFKVKKGKRFQKKLPKRQAFIFNDPKKANEFYKFIDAKIGFENQTLDYYLPVTINNKLYSFSYYEVSRTTKTINLLPMLIDSNRSSKGKEPLLEDLYTSENRKGTWYIAITIQNNSSTDCLSDNFKDKPEVVAYLKKLKDEYLSTYNYEALKMKRKG